MISALLQEGQSGRKKAPMPAKVFLAKAAKEWRTIVSVLLIVFLLRVILGGSGSHSTSASRTAPERKIMDYMRISYRETLTVQIQDATEVLLASQL